jgi:hypothetical protein
MASDERGWWSGVGTWGSLEIPLEFASLSAFIDIIGLSRGVGAVVMLDCPCLRGRREAEREAWGNKREFHHRLVAVIILPAIHFELLLAPSPDESIGGIDSSALEPSGSSAVFWFDSGCGNAQWVFRDGSATTTTTTNKSVEGQRAFPPRPPLGPRTIENIIQGNGGHLVSHTAVPIRSICEYFDEVIKPKLPDRLSRSGYCLVMTEKG